MPVYLINIRNLQPAFVGIILLGSAIGMGIGAQMGGRLADVYGHRRFTIIGFLLAIITGVFIANFNLQTSLILIVIILLFNGFSMGVWATPNQLATMNSVTKEKYGSVGAFVNLTRNTGNVIGQALATSIISFVMIYKGFDVELSEVGKIPKTTDAFILGWEIAYIFVIIITFIGLISAIMTKPKNK
jgi:MFS family permease